MITHLTNATFNQETATGTVLVDFWATWCGPCRMQGKILEESLEQLERRGVHVCKVNVDEEPELAERFGITSIPTIQVFENGTLKNQAVGVHNIAAIEAML